MSLIVLNKRVKAGEKIEVLHSRFLNQMKQMNDVIKEFFFLRADVVDDSDFSEDDKDDVRAAFNDCYKFLTNAILAELDETTPIWDGTNLDRMRIPEYIWEGEGVFCFSSSSSSTSRSSSSRSSSSASAT